ncbi:hypothetical protein ScPMuIL_006607 [Solemya velum]
MDIDVTVSCHDNDTANDSDDTEMSMVADSAMGSQTEGVDCSTYLPMLQQNSGYQRNVDEISKIPAEDSTMSPIIPVQFPDFKLSGKSKMSKQDDFSDNESCFSTSLLVDKKPVGFSVPWKRSTRSSYKDISHEEKTDTNTYEVYGESVHKTHSSILNTFCKDSEMSCLKTPGGIDVCQTKLIGNRTEKIVSSVGSVHAPEASFPQSENSSQKFLHDQRHREETGVQAFNYSEQEKLCNRDTQGGRLITRVKAKSILGSRCSGDTQVNSNETEPDHEDPLETDMIDLTSVTTDTEEGDLTSIDKKAQPSQTDLFESQPPVLYRESSLPDTQMSLPNTQSSGSSWDAQKLVCPDNFSQLSSSEQSEKEAKLFARIKKQQDNIEQVVSASTPEAAGGLEKMKQRLQTLAPLLSQLSDRHRTERTKLSTEIGKPHKSKGERREIREKLKQLGERQKQLLELFYRHKEISGLLKIKLLGIEELSTDPSKGDTKAIQKSGIQPGACDNITRVPPHQCRDHTGLHSLEIPIEPVVTHETISKDQEQGISHINEFEKYSPANPLNDVTCVIDDTYSTTSSLGFISDFLNKNVGKSIPSKRKAVTPITECLETKIKNSEQKNVITVSEKCSHISQNISQPISIEREIIQNVESARVQRKRTGCVSEPKHYLASIAPENTQNNMAIDAPILPSGNIENCYVNNRPSLFSNSQNNKASQQGLTDKHHYVVQWEPNSKPSNRVPRAIITTTPNSKPSSHYTPNIYHGGRTTMGVSQLKTDSLQQQKTREMQFNYPYQGVTKANENRTNEAVGRNFSQNSAIFNSPDCRGRMSSCGVSPCTSGSDVFSVKCKDLDRRLHERFGSQTQTDSNIARTSSLMDHSQRMATYQPMAGDTTLPQSSFKTPQVSTGPRNFSNKKYPPIKALMSRKLLTPGFNVFSAVTKAGTFFASLTEDGLITTEDGENYKTFCQWLSVILGLGSANLVRKAGAYRQVQFLNKPIVKILYPNSNTGRNANKPTGEPNFVSKDFSRVPDNPSLDISEIKDKPGLNVPSEPSACAPLPDLKEIQGKVTMGTSLTELLNGCNVYLIKDEEIIPGDDLPENFWSCKFSDVVVGGELWSQVDSWR